MKALVLYDSFFGNTQKVAEVVAGELGARAVRVADVKADDLDGLELLVIGSPIRGWKPSEKTQAFLHSLKDGQLTGLRATAFDTRVKLFIHGDAKDQMVAELTRLGAEIAVTPEAFYVAGKQDDPQLLAGELEKAKEWAEKIKATF